MKVSQPVKVVVVKHDINWQKAGAGLVYGAVLQVAYIAVVAIVVNIVLDWIGLPVSKIFGWL